MPESTAPRALIPSDTPKRTVLQRSSPKVLPRLTQTIPNELSAFNVKSLQSWTAISFLSVKKHKKLKFLIEKISLVANFAGSNFQIPDKELLPIAFIVANLPGIELSFQREIVGKKRKGCKAQKGSLLSAMSLVSGYNNTMSTGDMYSSYYNPPASTMQPVETGQNFYNAWAWNSPNVHQNPELSSTGHEFASSPLLSGSYTSGSPYGSPCQCIGPCQGHEYANSNGSTTSTVTYETFPGGTRVRVVKRRNTANKKERRRTMSINNAFTDLRDCIPNVPSDTKLSKIKTLRLATSYISYLMGVLEAGSQAETPFRAEIGRTKTDRNKESRNQQEDSSSSNSPSSRRSISAEAAMANDSKRSKGRTGWPHHVWALELKQ